MADNMGDFHKGLRSTTFVEPSSPNAIAQDAYQRGFSAGEASMRERAAAQAEACKPGFVSQFPDIAAGVKIADQYCDRCAIAIRALKGAT